MSFMSFLFGNRRDRKKVARDRGDRASRLLEHLEPRVLLATCPTSFGGETLTTPGDHDTLPGFNAGSIANGEVTVSGTLRVSLESDGDMSHYDIDVYRVEGIPGQKYTATYTPTLGFVVRATIMIATTNAIGETIADHREDGFDEFTIGDGQFGIPETIPASGVAYVVVAGGVSSTTQIDLDTGCAAFGQLTPSPDRSPFIEDLETYQLTITPQTFITPPSAAVFEVTENKAEPSDGTPRLIDLSELTADDENKPLFITVDFSDSDGVNESSLSGSQIRVIPPAPLQALTGVLDTLLTSNGSNDTLETAIYRVDPPVEGWLTGYAGQYEVEMANGNVRDVTGVAIAEGATVANGFEIAFAPTTGQVDEINPHLTDDLFSVDFGQITDGADAPIMVQVTFEDADGIDESSLTGSQLNLKAAAGLTSLAAVFDSVVTAGGNDMVETVIYRVDPPQGGWVDDFVNTYDVQTSILGSAIEDVNGNALAFGLSLGTVHITDSRTTIALIDPLTELDVNDLASADGSFLGRTLTVTLEFKDSDGLDLASAQASRIVLTQSNPDRVIAESNENPMVTGADGGNTLTVRYTFPLTDVNPDDLLAAIPPLLRTSLSAVKDKLDNEVEEFTAVDILDFVDPLPPVPTAGLANEGQNDDVSNIRIGGRFDDALGGVTLDVTWSDAGGVDTATIGNGGLIVRRVGDGRVIDLSFDSVLGDLDEVAFGVGQGQRIVARYKLSPPDGTMFTLADEGEYQLLTGSASGQPDQRVKDKLGQPATPLAPVQPNFGGQFENVFVTIDLTPPTAITEVQSEAQSGAEFLEFTVVWSDAISGVNASSVADALSIDPGGISLIPQLISFLPFEPQATYRATYRIDAPPGGFPTADYTISVEAGKGRDAVGNAAEQSKIVGSFTVRDGTVINVLAGKKFSLADALGRVADAALKSKTGQAVIVAAGTEIVTEQINKTTEKITGQIEKLTSIVVSETGIGDAFSFKSGKGSEHFDVDDVRVESPIGTLDLSGLNVLGNVTIDAAKKFIAGDIQDDHLIEIGEPADGVTAIDITLDRVANTDLISLTPIRTLTVTEWIDDDGDPDQIIAPWIGKIVVKGDKNGNIAGNFEADVVLTGEGAPKGVSLGSIKVPGDVRKSVWDIAGDVGSVDIKGAAVDWSMNLASTFKSIKMGAGTNVRIDIGDDDGGSIQAEKWTGSFIGGSIKSITGKANKNTGDDGDINIAVNLSGHSDPRKATLGKVSTKGDFTLQTVSPVFQSSEETLAPIVGDADSITAAYFQATAAFTGDIKSIKVERIGGTALQARSIKSIDVKSDIEILQVLLTQEYDAANPKQTALGRFKSKAGFASVIQVLSRGNIGTVEFDSFVNATIAAGVAFDAHLAGEPLYSVIQDLGNIGPAIALPTDAGGFESQAAIKSFKLKTGVFNNNSQIAAWQIDKVDLSAISEASPGTIVSTFIKSLTIGGDVGSVKLKNVDEDSAPDPVGAFEIRIVT